MLFKDWLIDLLVINSNTFLANAIIVAVENNTNEPITPTFKSDNLIILVKIIGKDTKPRRINGIEMILS